jgi:long-chain alkane monooxygenase
VSAPKDTRRQIGVNAFDMNCPTHLVAGTWRAKGSRASEYKDIGYWTDLARTCERGLMDGIFIADVLGVYDVFAGSNDGALRGGAQVPVNDPSLVVPAMAAVTEHLGFGITASTSFEHPYTFARRMSTLDHLTKGRVGWNIVTSYLESGAKNIGMDAQVRHDNRYDIADEYMEVLYKLWEGSWEDDAVVADPERNVYADPEKVHPIEHEGEYFKVPGIHLSEPSPQRTPLLYQAGQSKRGKRFAAEHAEAVFMGAPRAEILRGNIDDLRTRLVEAGRDPFDIRVFSSYSTIVAPTRAEAEEKRARYRELIDPEGTLVLWSGWLGYDLSPYDLDEPLRHVHNEAMQSTAETFGGGSWTVRNFIEELGFGADGPNAWGDPVEVADQIEAWVDATGADGLNLNHVVTPATYVDFAELVVPELQRRGRYRTAYDEAPTLRDKFFGRGSRLPDTHQAAGHRYRRDHAGVPA